MRNIAVDKEVGLALRRVVVAWCEGEPRGESRGVGPRGECGKPVPERLMGSMRLGGGGQGRRTAYLDDSGWKMVWRECVFPFASFCVS